MTKLIPNLTISILSNIMLFSLSASTSTSLSSSSAAPPRSAYVFKSAMNLLCTGIKTDIKESYTFLYYTM